MKKYVLFFISLFSILILAENCGSSSQLYTKLYTKDNKNRTYVGQLSDSIFTALIKYLTITSNSKLRDTIIIKYDYNYENCWRFLDQKDDDYILNIISRNQKLVQHVLATRQNVSVFCFREPGKNINKLKQWDHTIIIDSSKQLFNLLFKERCTCGSSIIVLPDKRYVFVRTDPHFEASCFTQNKIEELLKKK